MSTFLSQLKGFCRKTSKIEGGKIFIFGKKFVPNKTENKTVPNKTERSLWDFPTSILSQNSKKIEEETIWGKNFQEKKSRSAEKNWKGGPLGLAGYGMLRGKTGKTFLVQFVRPNSAIWCNNIL